MIVAHANDHAPAGEFLKTSGGLLLLFGVGSVIGPLLAAGMMTLTTPAGLFQVTTLAHVSIIGFALWRISRRRAMPAADKEDFVAMSSGVRFSTPETLTMDPRAEEEEIEEVREEAPDEGAEGYAEAGLDDLPSGQEDDTLPGRVT